MVSSTGSGLPSGVSTGDRTMMRMLVIVCGLPGSGKSHLAASIITDLQALGVRALNFEADQFMIKDGRYFFEPERLAEVHWHCRTSVEDGMKNNAFCIIVSNTSTREWERDVYRRLAREYHYQIRTIDLFDGGLTDEQLAARNAHGVPMLTIQAMRERYQKLIDTPDESL